MRYPISLSSVLCAQLIALGVQRLQRKSTFFIGETMRQADEDKLRPRHFGCVGARMMLDESCRDRMLDEDDYYSVLGVPTNANDRSIREAYRALVAEYHPDKRPAHFAEAAARRTAIVNRAYEVLKDRELRREYDAEREHDAAGARDGGGGSEREWRHDFGMGGLFRALCQMCSGVQSGLTGVGGTLATATALLAKLWRAARKRGVGVFARSRASDALALVAVGG